MRRSAFFVSDSTGITAETLGKSLLAQFDTIEFSKTVLPFIDTEYKAQQAVGRINDAADRDGAPPIIFDTIINQGIRNIIASSNGVLMDIFSTFLAPLEKALDTKSGLTVGRAHNRNAEMLYQERINAVNYAMENDDGARINHYDQAQVILIGVSRCGKTPSCLYMAMQHGIYAANYPLTDEDLERENEEKTSAVHFMRFELTAPMSEAAKNGAAINLGIDHENYRYSVEPLPQPVRDSLVKDLV